MTATLLCIGDIHLGRRPGHLPADLESAWGLDPARMTPAAAWLGAVDEAIRRQVDAVVLAGDVVEDSNRFFEAYGPLHEGASKLAGAGIAVFAVAGNHDGEVLPRLADEVAAVHLLGRDARWESVVLERDGEPLARLLGWSFPGRHTRSNPLADLPPSTGDDVPTLGVLHCDVDEPGSVYAPVSSAALRASHLDAWLLGHIHQPSLGTGRRPWGYLGSLVGLDPTETGAHGPWLVEVHSRGDVRAEMLPLAPLRWEKSDLDVSDMAPEDLEAALTGHLRALHEQVTSGGASPDAVGCRVSLIGRTGFHAELVSAGRDVGSLAVSHDQILYFVDRLDDAARPALDLEVLARGSDPMGLLARSLRLLEQGGEEAELLLTAARREMEAVQQRGVFAALEREELDDEAVRQRLLDAGYRALEALDAQGADAP